MIRKIVNINEAKCIGCEKCVHACHEGAIVMVNGKAHLAKETYCDGLGDCLPACPVDAIKIEEREALEYNEEEVMKNKKQKISITDLVKEKGFISWPIQLKLAPTSNSMYENKELVIAADCVAFSYGNFIKEYRNNNVLLIGCPKLDREDYSERLSQIIKYNNITNIRLVIMDVPCCSKMKFFLEEAILKANSKVKFSVDIFNKYGEKVS